MTLMETGETPYITHGHFSSVPGICVSKLCLPKSLPFTITRKKNVAWDTSLSPHPKHLDTQLEISKKNSIHEISSLGLQGFRVAISTVTSSISELLPRETLFVNCWVCDVKRNILPVCSEGQTPVCYLVTWFSRIIFIFSISTFLELLEGKTLFLMHSCIPSCLHTVFNAYITCAFLE